LDNRLAEHRNGKFGGYTSTRLPVELVFSEFFERIMDAVAAERQIKGWSRAKKEALIAGEMDKLRLLSKRRSSHKAHGSRRGASPRSSP
jgi:putative endonuclease